MSLVLDNELRLAGVVANRIGKRWNLVESEDLTSHLYLWLFENLPTLERWREEEGGEGKLYVSLRREAAKFCASESAAAINRPLSAGAAYPVDVLDRALPFIFELAPVTTVRVNPVTDEPLDDGTTSGLALAIIADIRGAFYGLPPEVQRVLSYRYRDGLTLEEIGELTGMTKTGVKGRLERALRRLSDALGTEDPSETRRTSRPPSGGDADEQ